MIKIERPSSIVRQSPSMISKLLRKEEELGFTGSPRISRNPKSHTVHFNEEIFIKDQQELIMASNNRHNKNYEENEPQRRIIDANALSSSLSASKFKLEDEFDTQLVIW